MSCPFYFISFFLSASSFIFILIVHGIYDGTLFCMWNVYTKPDDCIDQVWTICVKNAYAAPSRKYSEQI